MAIPVLSIGIVGQLLKGTPVAQPIVSPTSLENVVNTLYSQLLEDNVNIDSDSRGNVTLNMADANKDGHIDRLELTQGLVSGNVFLTFKDSSSRAKDRFLSEVVADQLDRDDGNFDGVVQISGQRFEKGQLTADLQSGKAVIGRELRVGEEAPPNLVALRKRLLQGAVLASP